MVKPSHQRQNLTPGLHWNAKIQDFADFFDVTRLNFVPVRQP